MKPMMKPKDVEKMDSKAHEKRESKMMESKEPKMKGDMMKDGCTKCGMDQVKS